MTTSSEGTELQEAKRLMQRCKTLSEQAKRLLDAVANLGDDQSDRLSEGFRTFRDLATNDANRLYGNLMTLADTTEDATKRLEKQQAEAATAKENVARRWKAISGPLANLELSPEAVALLPTRVAIEFCVLPVDIKWGKSDDEGLLVKKLFVRSDFIHRDDDSQHRFEITCGLAGLGYSLVQHLPIDLDEHDELTRLVQKYYAPKRLFGEIAIESGFITPAQLDEALSKKKGSMAHRPIGEILVRLGYISKPQIIQILVEQFHLRSVTVKELRDIPPETAKLLDGGVATLYRVIPLGFKVNERGEPVLEIATAYPHNVANFQNLEQILERPICLSIASPEAISAALSQVYKVEPNTPPEPFHLLGASGPITHVDPPPGLAIGGDIGIENDPAAYCGSPDQLDDPNFPPQDRSEDDLPEKTPDKSEDDEIFDL